VREDIPMQEFGGKAKRSKPLGITRRKSERNISVTVKETG